MEITGFDQQIGVAKKIVKAVKKIAPAKVFAPKKAITPARSVAPVKSVAPAKTIAVKQSTLNKLVAAQTVKKMQSSVKPSQIRVAPARNVAPAKTVAVKRSMINKLIAAKKVQTPTQKSPIVTAKQFNAFKSTAQASQPVTRTAQASQPVKVFSTDQTPVNTSPMQLLKMDDVKRSFARVDLPYQPVTPPTKKIRIKNTPIDLPVNTNMIEPAVDGGVNNYYGK